MSSFYPWSCDDVCGFDETMTVVAHCEWRAVDGAVLADARYASVCKNAKKILAGNQGLPSQSRVIV